MKRYLTSAGDINIPVASTALSEVLDASAQNTEFYIRFYSDSACQNPVQPSGGTVKFEASPDSKEDNGTGPFRYLPIPDGEFDAALTDSPDRAIPSVRETVRAAKVTPATIAGASHYRAWIEQKRG